MGTNVRRGSITRKHIWRQHLLHGPCSQIARVFRHVWGQKCKCKWWTYSKYRWDKTKVKKKVSQFFVICSKFYRIVTERNLNRHFSPKSPKWGKKKVIGSKHSSATVGIHPISPMSYCRNPLSLSKWIPTEAHGWNWWIHTVTNVGEVSVW